MENKVVNLELKTNVDESIAGLKALKRQLKDTAAGSDEFKKIYNQIDDLEDKIKSSRAASADWVDSLEQAGGPLGMLGAGINRAKVATQTFGGALKATGIGLIVSLLGGLVAAFSENEGAMKKLEPLTDGLKKAFQGVFRAVEPLFNTFVDLATDALPYVTKGIGMVYSAMMAYFTFIKESGGGVMKILKGVFTLDGDAISAGIDQVGGSFKKTQQSYGESMKRFSEGSKELTAKEKEEAEKREENARKSQEKREAAEANAKSLREKKKQEEADALKKIEEEKLAKEMQSAKDAMAILDELRKSKETPAEKETREYLEKKAVLEANNLSTEELTKKHLDNLAVIKKSDDDKKAEADKLVAEKKAEEDKKNADKALEIEKAVAEGKKAIQEQTLSTIESGLSLLKTLFEGNEDMQKALIIGESAMGIARIVIGTQAADAADAAAASLMGPAGVPYLVTKKILNRVSAGLGIAANIAATSKALSAMGGGGAPSSSASVGGGGGAAPTAPMFNVVGQGGANQIAQSIAGQEQQPLKAYVVSNDVTTSQSLDRNIVNNASIG
jgi:chemotaxis protein histidine kinase CheA